MVGDWQYNGVSQPRGLVLFEYITSQLSTTTTIAEQLLYTTGSIAWQPGRVYEVYSYLQVKSAAVQNPTVSFRKTNLAGTVLLNGPRVEIDVTGQDIMCIRHGYVVNDTGSVVNAPLALTVAPTVATVVSIDGSATPTTSPCFIRVIDVGTSLASGGTITGVSV
jgi:hypothetical protein